MAIGLLGGGLNLIWGGRRCGGHGHQGAAEHTPHLGGGARGGSMCVLGGGLNLALGGRRCGFRAGFQHLGFNARVRFWSEKIGSERR